jgi:hypothetical protein
VITRIAADLGAIARFAVLAPAQMERMLELGEEIASIGWQVLEIARDLDRRGQAIMMLGERLDGRAEELVELGAQMHDLGERIDVRGGEIADRAEQVAETGSELIAVMPTFERALEMATPLEGAIDRFGRLVDRLPGGARRPRPAGAQPGPSGTGDANAELSRPAASQPPEGGEPEAALGPGLEPRPAPGRRAGPTPDGGPGTTRDAVDAESG